MKLKNLASLATVSCLLAAGTASAQFSSFFEEDFGGTPAAPFDSPGTISPDNPNGNIVTDDNAFDYSTIGLDTAPGAGNGTGLFLSPNENPTDSLAQAVSYQLTGPSSNNYALEVDMVPYYDSGTSTSGGTQWVGMAVRTDSATIGGGSPASDFSGYMIQVRTDNSGTFGDYINFWKGDGSSVTFLGRYYFVVGSGGVAPGDLDDSTFGESNQSKAMLNTDETSTGKFINIRLEVVDDLNSAGTTNVKLIVSSDDPALDFIDTTIVDWDDPNPLPTSNTGIAIFQDDPFSSAETPSASAGGLFDRVAIEEHSTLVENWELF